MTTVMSENGEKLLEGEKEGGRKREKEEREGEREREKKRQRETEKEKDKIGQNRGIRGKEFSEVVLLIYFVLIKDIFLKKCKAMSQISSN